MISIQGHQKMFKFHSTVWWYLLFMLISFNSNLFVSAKSLENLNNGRNYAKKEEATCEHVKSFFDSINVTINPPFDKTGEICGGHCCDNKTESEVLVKSTKIFEGLIRNHTKSLKGLWESTSETYKDHVLELSRQSENKTLNLFSQVYRRMSPLSREPILELYKSIRSHITSSMPSYDDELESVIEKFFINLFPVAYHHAVHSQGNGEAVAKDFHVDYKNCLTHTYVELQPFGEIPSKVSRNLVQSVSAANVLLRALDKGAEVLEGTEHLSTDSLSIKCQHALLKMNYCASCKGHNHRHSKPCHGYCSNVMRGCLTQFLGSLDQDWSSFSENIERLMMLVRSKDGIETVIKGLDGKLSEAIMHAMENGPDLEKKVQKACGKPTLIHSDKTAQHPKLPLPTASSSDGSLPLEQKHPMHHTNKWVSPPDTQMLQFLAILDKSKQFSLRIADSYCEDERNQRDDKDCWTGDHLGDYTHTVISMHTQKYNPEVPTSQSNDPSNSKIHMLNDKLINLKNMVLKPITAHSSKMDSDKMLSDMAEGSGNDYPVDPDSDDYGDGSGSGHTSYRPAVVNVQTPDISPAGPGTSSATTLRISLFNPSTSLVALSLVYTIHVILNRQH